MIMDDSYQYLDWSADDWAKHLNCSKSTVHGTTAWKRIQTAKALRQAEEVTRQKKSNRRSAD
jgi:hypothetical protein